MLENQLYLIGRIKRRQSIVHDQSGVTRDRVYGQSEWNGIEFSIIDTGGYVEGSEDIRKRNYKAS